MFKGTAEFISRGMKLFQASLCLGDEETTCRQLHRAYRVPLGATVIDLGAGIGGVGHYFKQIDPTLQITSVTNDAAQIESMLPGSTPRFATMTRTGLDSGIADVVMFNESIGYGDLNTNLAEAMRLLKPEGILGIKTLFVPDHPEQTYAGYVTCAPIALQHAAFEAGFEHVGGSVQQWDTANLDRIAPTRNLKTHIAVFRKPAAKAATKNDIDFLLEAFAGNRDAVEVALVLTRVSNAWDDAIDLDRPVNPEAFWDAMFTLPANPVYRQYESALRSVLLAGTLNWEIANQMEAGRDRRDWELAHGLRYSAGSALILLLFLLCGRDRVRAYGPEMWRRANKDSVADYLSELESRHADQATFPVL